ncbi:MAG TPA: molybdenum cofactor biosynthesis protein MoaE [Thermoanaerobaculia bacterium]|nr:molybdenum cofactor biosynthesis protein MoaE [Thermoanaerobaculia bacterium]
MRIRLLAFASAGDALGAGELEIELPPGSRVADLQADLDRRSPRLAPMWPLLAVAVDGQIAGPQHELADGVEVALLPPVSGGSPSGAADLQAPPAAAPAPPLPPAVELVEGPIDLLAVAGRVAGRERGAIVLFVGTVRAAAPRDGRPVEKLTYSAYRPMALAGLQRIVADLERATPGLRVAIVHRLGVVPAGQASVVIAVASPHRAAAYEANRRALERLKSEVPIWKREHYEGGAAAWREDEPLSGRQ